ncbi:hypothetical protein [Ornithinibacillus xuwenensis]|uniref:ResB-like domain-containing protein n=1 Tax=Ornithinibacillus xuwenensis TaxID=3144668 RepID=A0ABU9XG03_9BACI
MYQRKIVSVCFGYIFGLTSALVLVSLQNQGDFILWNSLGFILETIWLPSPLLLYAIVATLLSDFITKNMIGKVRSLFAFLIHLVFGVLYGIFFPSNIFYHLFLVEINGSLFVALIVLIFFWIFDELIRFKKFTSKTLLFSSGTVLFFISIPYSTLTAMEFLKEKQLKHDYEILTHFSSNPSLTPIYTIGEFTISIEEVIPKNRKPYFDQWENKVILGDLSVLVNDQEVATLYENPIRTEWEGLGRYYGQISFISLHDNSKDKELFIVMLKNTPEKISTSSAKLEDLAYSYYQFDETGMKVTESFKFTERNHYQTFLLRNSTLSPYGPLHYYGDINYSPVFLIQSLIGVILLIYNFPFRKRYKS